MQSTNRRNRMQHGRLMPRRLKNLQSPFSVNVSNTKGGEACAVSYHLLPERRVEVARQLRSTVPDEELQGMLFLFITAPREGGVIGMDPQSSIDDGV